MDELGVYPTKLVNAVVDPEPQQAPAVEEVNPPAGEDGDCGDASVSCIGGISARENGVLPPEPRTVSDGEEKLDDEQVAPLNEMRAVTTAQPDCRGKQLR